MSRLSKALRLYLASTEIEQEAVAKELGISEAALSRFINGKNLLDSPNLIRLIGWLLEKNDE